MSSYVTPSFTKMLYGWSKWGGPTMGIVKEVLEEWNCQLCGAKQIIGLPQYFFPLDERRRDFLRICAGCKKDLEIAKIDNFDKLLKEIPNFKEERRKKVMIIDYQLKT